MLNLAFEQPRQRTSVEHLPRPHAGARRRWSNGGKAQAPFSGLSVLLIHHITSETLGLVAALRALGCDDLGILFVRYAGEVPNEYLDAVLDLDPSVRSFTLQHVQEPGGVEGRFVVSQQLSSLAPIASIAERLRATPQRYLESMIDVAVGLLVRALEGERRILVVEDGGYLMPALTRRAHAGDTVGQLAAAHGATPVVPALARRPLRAVLAERLVGSR